MAALEKNGFEIRFYSNIFWYNLYDHDDGIVLCYFSNFGIKNIFHKKSPKRYDLKHTPQFRNILCVKIYPFLELPTATLLLLGIKFSELNVSISEVFLRFAKNK